VAVTVTVESEVTVPAVTVKVAEEAPEAIVTEEGVVRRELLSESVTEVLLEAALESVTVQVLDPLELKLVGEQLSEERTAAVARSMDAVLETPLRVAVTVAVESEVIVPAVTVKVAEVLPAPTVTDEGVVSRALLSASETATPPLGAAMESATVQVALAEELSDVGVHERLLRLGVATAPPVMDWPTPAIIVALPAGRDAKGLLTATAVVVTPTPIVRFTLATTPFAIVVVFMPYSRQV
jgi:hypothetical protein